VTESVYDGKMRTLHHGENVDVMETDSRLGSMGKGGNQADVHDPHFGDGSENLE
jgi:hypothetical protein